jgi:hypothetical protein
MNRRAHVPESEAAAPAQAIMADLQTWNRQRWLYAILAGLTLHIALIWFFGRGPDPASGIPKPASTLHFATDPNAALTLAQFPDLHDAALLPMPGAHGFSLEGWLEFQPLSHILTDWTNAPRWLAPDATALGAQFNRLVDDSASLPQHAGDKPAPPLTDNRLLVSNIHTRQKSVLRLEGPLAQAGRSLLNPPELPSWTHSDLITNTVVQLLVDWQGWVFSTALIASSGSAEADQWALRRAKALNWTPDAVRPTPPIHPAPAEALTLGKLVFQWHTLPQSAELSTARVVP